MDTNEQEQFIEECQFAKIVQLGEVPALLIGGRVIRFDEYDWLYADAICRALRRVNKTGAAGAQSEADENPQLEE